MAITFIYLIKHTFKACIDTNKVHIMLNLPISAAITLDHNFIRVVGHLTFTIPVIKF